MYLDYYKLEEQPFGVTPNPRYLYLSSTHREAMASVWHGVMENRGFTAMIAHPGMGKTTLLFQLLEKAPTTLKTVFLFQMQSSPRDLLRNVLADLGVSSDGRDLARMQAQLNDVLVRETAAGRRVVVIVDEAQNLDEPTLEVLRVLSNFETRDEKLMHVVLAGQPELARKLASPNMVQLRQRVSVVVRLVPFKASETREYIEHRLKVAGRSAPRPLFSDRACDLITIHSQGVPRNINNICFNAMAMGFALQKKMIGPEIVREVLEDLDLEALTKHPYCPEGALRPAGQVATNPRRPTIAWLRGALIRAGLVTIASTISLSILSAACNVGEPAGWVGPVIAQAPAATPASNSSVLSESATIVEAVAPDEKLFGAAEIPSGSHLTSERDQFLSVQVGPRETLYGICIRHFGRYDEKMLREMQTLNPGLGDPKRIRAGRTVRLPVPQIGSAVVGRDSSATMMGEKTNE